MCRKNYKWWLTCCPELQLNHPRERRGEKYDVFRLENQEVESTKEREFVSVSDQRMEAIKKAALQDPEQCGLRHGLDQGWPSNISQALRPYWNVQDCLTVQDGVGSSIGTGCCSLGTQRPDTAKTARESSRY